MSSVPEERLLDQVELALFASRIRAVSDEMGAVLQRAAFSPNIRDRLDFSCALFDAEGRLAAQSAHIPVHLGSMAWAMRSLVEVTDWRPGDMLILNDPFLGGTHLPDVTLVAPVFHRGVRVGFVANRAHHADIGAESPGSMPLSRHLDEEGLVIPPSLLYRGGEPDRDLLAHLLAHFTDPARMEGDLAAQVAANRIGILRLQALVEALGETAFGAALEALDAYGERMARRLLDALPAGEYPAEDVLDDDGQGRFDLPIRVVVRRAPGADHVDVDFTGTAAQTAGNVNCPLSVTAAAVHYVFRCLMPPDTPACDGAFRPIRLQVPEGSLLNARRPAAVAAGNVETSSRVVDVLLAALAPALPDRIPAASQGTMNNIAMGSHAAAAAWDYYETLAGGMGGGPRHPGRSAVQTHLTNTRNTPIEVLESRYPVRVRRYALRRGSGGAGTHPGGDGLVREYEFLARAQVTLLTERRRHCPWGLAGGRPGACGRNLLNGQPLPSKVAMTVQAGDRLRIETPGGGGWGPPEGEAGA